MRREATPAFLHSAGYGWQSPSWGPSVDVQAISQQIYEASMGQSAVMADDELRTNFRVDGVAPSWIGIPKSFTDYGEATMLNGAGRAGCSARYSSVDVNAGANDGGCRTGGTSDFSRRRLIDPSEYVRVGGSACTSTTDATQMFSAAFRQRSAAERSASWSGVSGGSAALSFKLASEGRPAPLEVGADDLWALREPTQPRSNSFVAQSARLRGLDSNGLTPRTAGMLCVRTPGMGAGNDLQASPLCRGRSMLGPADPVTPPLTPSRSGYMTPTCMVPPRTGCRTPSRPGSMSLPYGNFMGGLPSACGTPYGSMSLPHGNFMGGLPSACGTPYGSVLVSAATVELPTAPGATTPGRITHVFVSPPVRVGPQPPPGVLLVPASDGVVHGCCQVGPQPPPGALVPASDGVVQGCCKVSPHPLQGTLVVPAATGVVHSSLVVPAANGMVHGCCQAGPQPPSGSVSVPASIGVVPLSFDSENLPLNDTTQQVKVGKLTFQQGHRVNIGAWNEVLPGLPFLDASCGGLGGGETPALFPGLQMQQMV